MTRAELLSAFEAALNGYLLPASGTATPPASSRSPRLVVLPDDKSGIVESESSVDGQHTIEHHICYYFDLDTLNGHNAQFYVVDRGTANEVAYWMQARDPKPPAPELTFQQKVLAWLRARVGQTVGPYTIKHVATCSADGTAKTATASILVDEADVLRFIDVYLWLDADDVNFQVIPTT